MKSSRDTYFDEKGKMFGKIVFEIMNFFIDMRKNWMMRLRTTIHLEKEEEGPH